jgi:hypothetical protein
MSGVHHSCSAVLIGETSKMAPTATMACSPGLSYPVRPQARHGSAPEPTAMAVGQDPHRELARGRTDRQRVCRGRIPSISIRKASGRWEKVSAAETVPACFTPPRSEGCR